MIRVRNGDSGRTRARVSGRRTTRDTLTSGPLLKSGFIGDFGMFVKSEAFVSGSFEGRIDEYAAPHCQTPKEAAGGCGTGKRS